jgi:hypothetical protein
MSRCAKIATKNGSVAKRTADSPDEMYCSPQNTKPYGIVNWNTPRNPMRNQDPLSFGILAWSSFAKMSSDIVAAANLRPANKKGGK